ncbi:hypothetical protein [Neptunomonas qingdaonensis]|uniref:Uncharacterized protein n=1 Tax=Neptunomonas qingdaonensis TaxID=1045558 RepID=A0A1I2TY07_9GAMM|nr:hypothetical protein [Neptunomonas qingdaonensis]SFG69768.1 hypothetical protein SAMN05216175_11186 [Neptunomonas qingdaonensis]
MRRGRYYLGRVVKINLDQVSLMNAIANAPIITIGKFDWTITDITDNRHDEFPYVFGKLSKYAKDGHAKVIDEISRSQIDADVPNLLEASSSFVYLPECSGIAFLHVWNGIQEDVFTRRFKSVIEAAFDGFMVACDVEPISDYRAFTSRLKKLSHFTEFSATVYPPNPLFGRLWGSLNEYIDSRNASEVSVKELTSKPKGLKSKIIELMDKIMDSPDYEPDEVPAIGDAAILMAADGYGRGKVVGFDGVDEVVIKTSDTQKSFLHEKEPAPNELALKAKSQFDKVSRERDMKH